MGSQDLQQARYDQLIRRVGALYGGGSKVVEVLPELFPVIEVENTTPELLAFLGWRLAWQNIQQNAVALQTSAVQLSNPAGSGMIASVTQIIVRTATPEILQVEVTPTLFVSAAIRGLFRDSRLGGDRATALELRSDPDIATGAGLRLLTEANVESHIRDDNGFCVLTPGSALQVGTVNDNVALPVNFFWRERVAEPSELNFP
ncbi:MAG: hypothetical protein V3S54_09320 [Woeseiaceae bacterium]